MAFRDWLNRIADPANRAWVISILIHVVLVALLLFRVGFELPKSQPSPELIIQATVIDESKIRERREAEQRAREEEARKQREAEEKRRREEEARKQREAEAKRQRDEEARKQREAQAKRQREEEARKQREAEAKRQREEEARKQREAEAKRQREEEARKQREAEEQRQREEEARKQREAEEQRRREEEARRQAEAAAKAQREQELRDAMAQEEALNAAARSGELARYRDIIRQKVERNWIRPAGSDSDLECEVLVSQIPGGDVVGVRIGQCNGGPAVVRSIEAAVLKSSPLPMPDNPALFNRNLRFVFRPVD